MNSNQNKPLVTHIFTADPSAHVFDGKIYVYPSHDLPHDCEDNDNGDQYNMEDYHILSMDSIDAPCVDNGEALHMKDVPWVREKKLSKTKIQVYVASSMGVLLADSFRRFFSARKMDSLELSNNFN